MTNLFPNKIISGFVEVFPDVPREEGVPVLEKAFGVSLDEREADEYSLFEKNEKGVSYQLALNYDWHLEEKDKKSIEVHVTSYWEDRERLMETELAEVLKYLPTNLPKNEYGHIIISAHLAEYINKSTGYRCEIDENET